MLRNREVRRTLSVFVAVTLIAVIATYLTAGQAADYMPLAVLMFGLVMIAVWWISTRQRYRELADMALEIDRVLHGESLADFEKFSEGELNILQSEISKMTLRLKEQYANVSTEKRNLADALADISHQIRTPLTSVHLMVERLHGIPSDSEEGERILAELTLLLGRIDRLITALLKLSRLDAGMIEFDAEEISVQELVETAVRPIMIPMELKEQQLIVEVKGSLTCDAEWTGEALGNILKNCMEHTPVGGRIAVTSEETPLYSELSIRDTGPGIAAEDLPHIFERFYKGVHSDGNSYGIGLALARMVVTAQGGTLTVKNTSEGACFVMRFYRMVV